MSAVQAGANSTGGSDITRGASIVGGGGGSGGGGGGGGAGVGGRDASTVRCRRMGNGSGAVLARRVDGAQPECASAARGLGAARVPLSVNARAAAAAQYKRPGAAVGGTAGGVAGGAAGGRR